jgi:sigma-B regulation protein RsbU (phosphoserine phosphatase)
VRGAPPGAREARAAEVTVLRAVGARLLVQIRTRGRLTGVLSLGSRESAAEFSPDEKLMLRSVAGQLALVLENSRLLERMVEEERLRRELALAAEVQRRLFPEGPSSSPFVELAGYCQPARVVGGDYYDFLAFQNGQMGVAVADVAGKGIAAALLMSTLQASLRAQVAACTPDASAEGALAVLVSNLNLLLCNWTGPASYVTFFYAQFDPAARRLVYVNAGHNPPLFLRAGHTEEFQRLSSGGTVVGLFEHYAYEQEAVQMGAGDVLLAYTDGLSEALNARGEEFGEARVRRALAECAPTTVEEIRDEIVRRVQEWCRDAPQHDDLTFVVVKVR